MRYKSGSHQESEVAAVQNVVYCNSTTSAASAIICYNAIQLLQETISKSPDAVAAGNWPLQQNAVKL